MFITQSKQNKSKKNLRRVRLTNVHSNIFLVQQLCISDETIFGAPEFNPGF